MNKTIALLLLTLLSFSSAFCQGNITIAGSITNPSADNIIVVNATSTKVIPDAKQDKVMLDKDGKFNIIIPVTEKFNWIIIVHNNKRIDFYAEAGTSLNLKATGNNFDTDVQFDGKGSELPQYFADASKTHDGIMAYYKKLQQACQHEPAAVRKSLDSVKTQEEDRYNTTANKNISKDFAKFWYAFLTYATYDAMLQYPMIHQMMARQQTEIPNIPKPLFEVPLKTPKEFDDKKLDIPFYQSYVQGYYVMMLNAVGYANEVTANSDGSSGDRSKALQQTDSVLKLVYKNMPSKTAEFAAGRIIATESKTWTPEELESHVASYKKQFPKSTKAAELDNLVSELKKFNPGQPALDFKFTTIDGKDMKLSELKGKVVYLDFWASWCGPCKGEMPYAKQVKEHFKDRTDVVFLYISIDDKEDAWKRGIEALNITGMHTRTSGWGGNIATQYEIQSIPAYFLIDKKGNFAIKKTPRPSETAEVIKLIEGLL
jgi:thiol-disulfide isomerase/thioredoxin